jgi:uncharacterized protein (DUF1330 family)
MAKAYWVVCYRAIKNPDKLAAYAKLAAPAIQAAGGRFLVRGTPAKTHDTPGYQEALRVLGDAVERDMRIVEGVS